MKVFNFIEVIDNFHKCVLRENTGNAQVFANKLGVSRATIYNIIAELDAYGIEIKYSRFRGTYYYRYPENVNIIIKIVQIE